MQNTLTPVATQSRLLALLCAIFAASSLVWGQSPARPQVPEWQSLIQKAFEAQQNGRVQDSLRLVGQAWATLRSGELAPGELASAAQQIAGFYQNQGYDLKAEAVYKSALDLAREQKAVRVSLLQSLSQLYQMEQRNLKAISTLREALKAGETAYGPNSQALAMLVQSLAMQLEQAGNLDEAEAQLKRLSTLTETQRQELGSQRTAAARETIFVSGPNTIILNRGFSAVMMPVPEVNSALAGLYQRHNRIPEAEQIYRDALSKTDSNPNIQTLNEYASFLLSQKRYQEAAEIQMRVIKMQESSDPHFEMNGFYSKLSLASTYVQAGQFEKASEIYQQAAANAKQPEVRFQAQSQYASALEQQSKYSEAESILRKISEDAKGDGPNSAWQSASALRRLAMLRERQGDKAGAEEYQKQAALQNERGGYRQPYDLAGFHKALSDKRWDDAEREVEQFLSQASTQPGESGCFGAQGAVSGAQQLWIQAQRQSAEALVRRAISICEAIYGSDSPRGFQIGYEALSQIYIAQKRWKEAEALWTHAVNVNAAAKGDDSPALSQPLMSLVNTYRAAQKLPQARETLARVASIQESASGPNHPMLISVLEQSGQMALSSGDWPAADQFWKRTLAISETAQGKNSPLHIHTLSRLARQYYNAEHREEGIAMIEQAVELAKQSPQAADLLPMLERERKTMLTQPAPGMSPQSRPVSLPAVKWFNPSVVRSPEAPGVQPSPPQ